ncbi:M67 family metallopeptidase [Paenibacillus sp. P25]|nr:M67 family metallopeptidase [Paenibacillus sp. P25]
MKQQILRYCSFVRPHEACGFLAGHKEAEHQYRVDTFIPIRNVHPEPENHFQMDPLETISVLSRFSPGELIGIVHSHPRAALVPSGKDLNTEWHTVPSHWIVSLAQASRPVIEAYGYIRSDDRVCWIKHFIKTIDFNEQQKNPRNAKHSEDSMMA